MISSRPAWLKRQGKPAKYYDTRIEYDDGYELGFAQLFLPASSHLPVGAAVRVVRSRQGELSVLPDRQQLREAKPGESWKKPDLKAVLYALIAGAVLIGALVASVTMLLNNSQDKITDLIKEGPTTSPGSSGTPTPTPTITPSPTQTP
ncbi:MAG: hypothetical protein HOQ05_00845 [Corynebacteriales bacterium]|nr:hypothetical protein [Mycobacteriales bacterium]